MKIPTAKQFLADEVMKLDGYIVPTPEDCVRIMDAYTVMILEQHITHPMKPGYRRSDIMKRIKELKS